MKKVIAITLLCSTFTFASGYKVPSMCEAAFIKSYSNYFIKTAKIAPGGAPPKEILKILKEESLPKQMADLEREYHLVSRKYMERVAEVKEEFAELAKANNLDFKTVQEMMSLPQQQVLIDTLEQLNAITDVTHKILLKQGMSVELKGRAVEGTKLLSSYLEVSALPAKKYFNSVSTINRYKERFGTKFVTFDFMQNMKSGSAGFSDSISKRIDLGFRGMRNMVLDDLITMVGKHEFKHAAFAAKRLKGKDSVYHAQYIARGQEALSSVPNHYSHYMSAEELYNFTNNPFWASNRIGDISKYNSKDYLADLNGIFYYIKETNKIAAQTKEVTETVLKYLRKSYLNPGSLGDLTVFFKADRTVARTADEVVNMAFIIPERNITYVDWAGSKELRQDVKNILENKLKLDKKYSDAYKAADTDGQLELVKQYNKEEAALNKYKNKKLLRYFIKKQEKLNKVATNIRSLNEDAVQKTEDFISYFNMRMGIDPGFKDSKEAGEKLLELRKMYRKLGDHVKEDYKGFVGR